MAEHSSEIESITADIDWIATKHVSWNKGVLQISGGGDRGIWATEVVGKVSRLTELEPGNGDHRFLEVCALLAGLQFRTAEQRLRALLVKHPDHLEARLMLEWGQGWRHPLTLPRWDDSAQTVPEQIQTTGADKAWRSVRVGVQRVVSAFLPPAACDFRGPVTTKTRCKIEPVFSDTPAGAIVAIYVMVEDNAADPLKVETFLNPAPHPDAPRPWDSGNFLLQQLALQDFTYIVAAPGGQVKLNRKLVFDSQTRDKLGKVAERVKALPLAESDPQALVRAAQWHMQRFSLDDLRF
jgi:hypothetical protein